MLIISSLQSFVDVYLKIQDGNLVYLLFLLAVGASLIIFLFSPLQPLWRFTNSPDDGRSLVYRSQDIKNLSRIASPEVCGYMHAEADDLLPPSARRQEEHKRLVLDNGEFCCPVLLRLWIKSA